MILFSIQVAQNDRWESHKLVCSTLSSFMNKMWKISENKIEELKTDYDRTKS